MSTWHSEESLSEALWFLLFNAFPDDAYSDECRSAVAITIGSWVWAREVRAAFTDPGAFSARVLASEEGPA